MGKIIPLFNYLIVHLFSAANLVEILSKCAGFSNVKRFQFWHFDQSKSTYHIRKGTWRHRTTLITLGIQTSPSPAPPVGLWRGDGWHFRLMYQSNPTLIAPPYGANLSSNARGMPPRGMGILGFDRYINARQSKLSAKIPWKVPC